MERSNKKKSEKIHRLKASIAHLTRSAPISSHFARTPPPVISESRPVSAGAINLRMQSDEVLTNVPGVPLARSPLMRKERAEIELLPLRHLSPIPRVLEESSRVFDPNTTPTKMTPPRASPSLASTKTPRYIRELDLSPTSKARALLSTPNTIQAAHAMSMLANFPQPAFSLASEEQQYELASQEDSEEREESSHRQRTKAATSGSPGRELKRKEAREKERSSKVKRHLFGNSSNGLQRQKISTETAKHVGMFDKGSFPTPSPRRVATISGEAHEGLD